MKNLFRRKFLVIQIMFLGMLLTLCACGAQSQSVSKSNVDFNELEETGQLELSYATQFSVKEYGEYSLISIEDESSFLLIPENAEVPYNLPDNTVVLQQPLDHTYLVSTSVMDLIRQIDAMDQITLSGSQEEDWYIPEAQEAMEEGTLVYAGKYSAPDYELILSDGCNLAIENTMIYHNPDVKEKLEELGIPVLVERSSYESHPLGRLEWIKLYGILYGKEDEATSYFDQQVSEIQPVLSQENTGKTVAFFSVTSNGSVTVRKPNDYIAQMIGMAGGTYVLNEVLVEEENALSTMNMQMEDFYTAAKDADILIYNSTIEGQLDDIDALIEKSSLFSDFKGVQEKEVYCTSKNFFQETTGVAEFIEDLHGIMTGDDSNLTYLKKLN